MKRVIISSISFLTVLALFNCSAKKELTKQNPYPQASAQIVMNNGTVKEGLIIKKKDNDLIYVDSKSHKKETLKFDTIKSIKKAGSYYDFRGDIIPVAEIKSNKGVSKTFSYGAGGLILGAAAGAAVGIALKGAGIDLDPKISIGVFGAVGAVWFGLKGSDRDFDAAVYETQFKRYKKEQEKKNSELKKELEEEKRKLEESKKQKKELLKKTDDKDN